jgi:hypothetical protein
MKICTKCKISKQDTDFRIRHETRRGGKYSYLNSTCRKCDSAIQQEYYLKYKDELWHKEKTRNLGKEYYRKNKILISEKNKQKRQTPEYKAMVRSYREKNKNKIKGQEVITKKRYHEKNCYGLTDKYIVQQLIKQEIADRVMLEMHPEIIEAKRLQLLIIRKTKQHANQNNV